MYVLLFSSFVIIAFGTTLPNKNYAKISDQKEEALNTYKKRSNCFAVKHMLNIFSYKEVEKPYLHSMWYMVKKDRSANPIGLLKVRMLMYMIRKSNSTSTEDRKNSMNVNSGVKTTSLPLRENEIDFLHYYPLDKMYKYLNSLQWKYPHIVNVEVIGKSFEKRDIKLVKVSTGDVGTKATIMTVGGMNSNEWISPATVLYVIQQLVENPVNNYMLANADWFFIPIANPDGYEYSFKKHHQWKKTRSHGSDSDQCIGVDLNKNYDYRCSFGRLNNTSCGEFYAGTKPFSEEEAKAMLDFVTRSVQIQLFVNINSYGQSLEFPLDNTDKFIQDFRDLQYLAEKVSYAVYKYGGHKYEVRGFNSCGSEQWARREGIKYSYNLKLPLENKQRTQVRERDILPIAQEVLVAFREFQQILVSIYGVTYDLISED